MGQWDAAIDGTPAPGSMAEFQHVTESGLCACGCGEPTTVARKTSTRWGVVKGQPIRFVHGHNARKPGVEYRTVVIDGRQREIHRVRAERALGKPLPAGAVVHHADGSRSEHAPLVICQDRHYHQLLHIRMRVKAAGGNPNTDALCTTCKRAKPRGEFSRSRSRRYGLNAQCKSCVRAYNQQRREVAHAV
jgi:hypothetical protein